MPRLVPTEYAGLGWVLLLLAVYGAGAGAPTLAPAVVLVVGTVAVSFGRRRPFQLLLVDVWSAAFAYLYVSDLVLTDDAVLALFGPDVKYDAEAFIVAAFAATLLGAAAFARFAARRGAAAAPAVVHRRRIRPSPALTALLAATTLMVLAFVFLVLGPSELFATARVDRSFEDTASRPLFIAATVMQPILAAYVTRRYRARGPVLLLAWAIVPLAALALYASGTRFYLGFMLCGVLHYVLQPLAPMSSRRCLMIGLAAIAFMALQGTMRASRTMGLVDLDSAGIADALSNPETFLSSEGLLRVNAWVHEKRAWQDPARPFENAFILYWWVPRSVWAGKPEMEGRRLIEDVMDEGYYNANHSVAGGFSMPALLDFGPIVGVAFSLLYGVALGAAQRFTWRHLALEDPASPIVALIAFGVFFTARGLHTGLIFISLCLLFCAPVLWIERRRAAAPRAPRGVISATPVAPGTPRRAYA
jgi:hypothetical protein